MYILPPSTAKAHAPGHYILEESSSMVAKAIYLSSWAKSKETETASARTNLEGRARADAAKDPESWLKGGNITKP